jgi:hypothetical protein
VASGFVGALALATSTYNVYLQRQQVRAAVWPRLVVAGEWTSQALSIKVSNRGAGPAEVKSVRVLVDGKPAKSWEEAQSRLLHSAEISMSWQMVPFESEVMSPGLEITTLKIDVTDNARQVLAQRRRLGMEVCYCSTLGDCWMLRTPNVFEAQTTMEVPACAASPEAFRGKSDLYLDSESEEWDASEPDAAHPGDGG